MKKRVNSKTEKLWIGVLVLLAVLITTAGLAVRYHTKGASSQTETKCSDYPGGFPVWPDNLSVFTGDAYGVVVGTVLNPEEQSLYWSDDKLPIKLRITDIFKGESLHQGDVLSLCSNTMPDDFADDTQTVLVFLSGENQGIWVPLQGEIGVIPQSENGRFQRVWGDDSTTSATINELHNLIKQ